ncbi:hypothetical protein TNCV_2428201 [Trichonephila clavipes]|nr:hypothetical protein TNCV_2428201 [Trichonephila clavipes]
MVGRVFCRGGTCCSYAQVSEEATHVKVYSLRRFRPVHRAEANRTPRIWQTWKAQSEGSCGETPVQQSCLRQSETTGMVARSRVKRNDDTMVVAQCKRKVQTAWHR